VAGFLPFSGPGNDVSRGLLMLDGLIRSWWTPALRGIAAVLFGVLALVMPGLTLGRLVSLFGLYALADGGLALLAGSRPRAPDDGDVARLQLVEGIVGLAAGALTLLWPDLSVFVLLTLAAARSIVVGGLQVAAGVRLRRAGQSDWLLAIAGLAAVAFGLVLVLLPGAGLWWLALSGVTVGALLTMFALRLRDGGRIAATA
jgi:uncharacterized membrane protein HdeD (DUF308 family)